MPGRPSSTDSFATPLRRRDNIAAAVLLVSALPWVSHLTHDALFGGRPAGRAPELLEVASTVVGLAFAILLWWRINKENKRSLRFQQEAVRANIEWELTFDSVPDPVIVVDEERLIRRANRAASAAFDKPLDAIVGSCCQEVVRCAGSALHECPNRLGGSSDKQEDYEVQDIEGRKAFRARTARLQDSRGRFRGCVHVLHDVTQSKRAEETLRLQALTFENMHDAVVVTDPQGVVRDWNPGATRTFGYTREEMLGKQASRLTEMPQSAVVDEAIQTAVTTSGRFAGEVPFTTKSGSHGVCELVVVPVLDQSGAQVAHVAVSRDITERKETELALRDRESQWRMLLDSTAEAIYGVDLDGNCTFCNPACVRMLGYISAEDLLGRNMHVLIHHTHSSGAPYDVEDCHIYKAFSDGELTHVEDEVLWRCDGSSFAAEYWSYPTIKDGRTVGAVVTFVDVSERIRASDALRQSEERYRMLFESNPQPMWVYEPESLRFLAVNEAAIGHYGYSRGEFLSMTLRDIRPLEDVPVLLEMVTGAASRTGRAGVWRHRTKDGRTIYVDIVEGQVEFSGCPAALILAIDVTEQIKAEQALLASEEKYRDLVENATYGIFRSTEDGTLLDVNSAFVSMLGYSSKQELLAQNLERDLYINPSQRRQILAEYGASGEKVAAEVNLKRKDGRTVTMKMTGRTFVDARRKLSFEVIAEDVTEQRQLESQFRQAQKMEAVGKLAGGIAHDFNNLLMIVNSYAELITMRASSDPSSKRHANEIIEAGRRAAKLTGQLLAFSRKQILMPMVLDLNDVVREFSSMLSRMVGEDVEMSTVLASDLGRISADRAQIEQVLMNLAANARDAMPDGGTLTIETQNVELGVEYQRTRPQVPAGDYVLLMVSDSGSGMDTETQARIFEPFFTTKPVGKGTGLGMAMVYGIVKQSGGFVWLYSEVGRGTCFKIYLPKVDGAPAKKREATPSVRTRGAGETVLLVDDEAALRAVTSAFLGSQGYRVIEASNGADALEICAKQLPVLDLLITDLIMPGMRGASLAAEVTKRHPQVKTIFMSGYTDRFREIAELGPEAVFLQKPIPMSMLAQKIRSVLDTDFVGNTN